MNIPTAIALSTLSIPYSVGCSYYIFLWVLGRKRVGRLESNQQKRLPTNSAGPLSTDGFLINPCEATSLARDAHPFALILRSSRGREVNGSRIRLHTLCRYASGLKVDDKQVSLAAPRGITKPPHVWRYDVRDLHVVDLYWLVITCAPNHTQGYQVEHICEGAFPRSIPWAFVACLSFVGFSEGWEHSGVEGGRAEPARPLDPSGFRPGTS